MKLFLSLMLTLAVPVGARGQSDDPELAAILQRVRERVTRHYLDLQTLAWTDTAKRETLNEDQTPREKPRELVYDAIIRLQEPAAGDHSFPFYTRAIGELRLVDGKPVKKNQAPESTDPRVANMNLLTPFLATDARASNWAFSYAGPTELQGRKVLRIDITSPQKTPPQVTWDDAFVFFGVRYRFRVSGVHYNKGTLWVDPETYDVLQLEWRSDPFEFQRKPGSQKVTYEVGMKARFQSMPLTTAGQTIAAPVSAEFTTTITKEKTVVIYRTTNSFTHYKRFAGDARVLAIEGVTHP